MSDETPEYIVKNVWSRIRDQEFILMKMEYVVNVYMQNSNKQ